MKGATHICFPLGKEEVSTHGQAVRFYLESKPKSQRAENILCTGPFRRNEEMAVRASEEGRREKRQE